MAFQFTDFGGISAKHDYVLIKKEAFTVRKILTDCSNLIIHLSNELEDELLVDSPLLPWLVSIRGLLEGTDSSTTTFSSLSCNIVAWTLTFTNGK